MEAKEINIRDEILCQEILETISPGWFAYINSSGEWKYPPHLRYLDKALHFLVAGKFSRLMVNMPPRHGKSEMISKYFPAWYINRFPDKRIILTSYSADFASMWGRLVKEILITRSIEGKSDLRLSKDSHAMKLFSIANRTGSMVSTGAGCSLTGRGADLLIIDDPVKNNEEANSEKILDNIWEWFVATAYTRLEPGGKVVLLMTRWHDDDLCGRIAKTSNIIRLDEAIDSDSLLPSDKETWVKITLPAIAEDDDELGRNIGEPLWAVRYDESALAKIKLQAGAYWFASLYQQSPIPGRNPVFKREHFSYFTEDSECYHLVNHLGARETRRKDSCLRFATVDLASSISQTSDYTVILTYAHTPQNEILVLDVLRQRLAPEHHKNLIATQVAKWNLTLVGIEQVGYQAILVNEMSKAGFQIKALTPKGNKVLRAGVMKAKMALGKVYFPTSAHWLSDFEDELMRFPDGRHDDQVDAFAYIGFMTIDDKKPPVLGCGKKERVGDTMFG